MPKRARLHDYLEDLMGDQSQDPERTDQRTFVPFTYHICIMGNRDRMGINTAIPIFTADQTVGEIIRSFGMIRELQDEFPDHAVPQ